MPKESWVCPACLLINNYSRRECRHCATGRPVPKASARPRKGRRKRSKRDEEESLKDLARPVLERCARCERPSGLCECLCSFHHKPESFLEGVEIPVGFERKRYR